jgi:AcrR family transcriptional regulator
MTTKANATPTTRDRLLAEGMRLFAERGFRGTTVGDIEAAAGLTRRAGAMYKHFRDKRALLTAAVEGVLEDAETMRSQLAQARPVAAPPVGPAAAQALRDELAVIGRWLLAELSRTEHLTRVLEKDGDLFPELVDRIRVGFGDAGHREAVRFVRRWAPRPAAGTGRVADQLIQGAALMLIGSLANYRRVEWMLGAPPLGIPEKRFLAGWVAASATLIEGIAAPAGAVRP